MTRSHDDTTRTKTKTTTRDSSNTEMVGDLTSIPRSTAHAPASSNEGRVQTTTLLAVKPNHSSTYQSIHLSILTESPPAHCIPHQLRIRPHAVSHPRRQITNGSYLTYSASLPLPGPHLTTSVYAFLVKAASIRATSTDRPWSRSVLYETIPKASIRVTHRYPLDPGSHSLDRIPPSFS